MSDESPVDPGAPRRSFLVGMGAVVIGGLAGLVPIVSGALTLLDPLRRRGNDSGMTLVTKLAVLPESGEPRKFTVRADKIDAWTTVHDAPIGSVYLRWTEEGVRALNVACPHAGCFVGVAPGASHFACPCHKSSFHLDGAILDPASPAPRGMDRLEVEVRNGDEVWVRFENFQPGRAEKTPVL